jgi:hypothetical protein
VRMYEISDSRNGENQGYVLHAIISGTILVTHLLMDYLIITVIAHVK